MDVKRTLFAVLALALSSPAAAVDGWTLAAGGNPDDETLVRAGVWWDTPRQWPLGDTDTLRLQWEANLAYWHADDAGNTNNSGLYDLGVTPVLRLLMPGSDRRRGYLEGGVGAHLISETGIHDQALSTTFQFGSLIGAGYLLDGGRYELGLRLQHLSNAGIEEPNDGINFVLIRFGRRLR